MIHVFPEIRRFAVLAAMLFMAAPTAFADAPGISFGGSQVKGPSADPSAEGQVFIGIPGQPGKKASTNFHPGLRIYDPGAGALNPTFGPNFKAGCPTNFIDPACSSCTIAGGGRPGWENQILHTSGQTSGTEFTFVWGYDNKVTDGWPAVVGGAHNYVNTNSSNAAGLWTGVATGTISSSGTTVTGSGTSFLTTARPGYLIRLPGGTGVEIATITSDTVLTTVTALSPAASASTWFQSAYINNPSYVPSANCNHSSVPYGTYNWLGNSTFAQVTGTHCTLGYSLGVNRPSDFSAICGGQLNIVTGQGVFTGSGQRLTCLGAANSALFGSDNQLGNTASNNSVIGGGGNASNSAYTFNVGNQNSIGTSSNGSVAMGRFQSIAAADATATGNQHSITAAATYGTAQGRQARLNILAERGLSAGFFGAAGDSQANDYVLRAVSTSSASVRLTADGTTGTAGRVTMGSASSTNFTCINYFLQVTAIQSGTANMATWNINVMGSRGNGVGTAVLTAKSGESLTNIAPTISAGTGSSSWKVNLAADTATDATLAYFAPAFIGADSTNVRVTMRVQTVETSAP